MAKKDAAIVIFWILIITLIFNIIPYESSNLFLNTSGESKEFEVEKFQENITLPYGGIEALDFNLKNGVEFEIVYVVQVKEGLPIDLWFVNEDNYLLLISDVNFLYYFDGSDKEVSYTRKLITFKEEGIYKLVLANIHNNHTVTANIVYEIRSYQSDSNDDSLEFYYILFYPLIIAVIVLSVLSVFLYAKGRMLKQENREVLDKVSSKKKSKKRKYKKPKPKVVKKEIMEKEPGEDEIKEGEPEITQKGRVSFCGFCGASVSTPFCKECGRKV